MPSTCPSKTKGAYVFESKPVVPKDSALFLNPDHVLPPGANRPPISLLSAPSGEYGPDVLSAEQNPAQHAAMRECLELRKAMGQKRAAKSRRFMQSANRGDAKTSSSIRNNVPSSGAYLRSSASVQTGLYLEQLTEAIALDDFATQTDEFLDRPATPLFVPAKTGQDVETQIYDGDLFDFDLEVMPILEVLVGKTMEQALLEVLEEEELGDLRRQQQLYMELYNADLAEVARLEDQNRRYREEKERRVREALIARKRAAETAKKIAARAFTNAFLGPLVPNVLEQLLQRGYFYDSTEKDIEVNFLATLLDSVVTSLDSERRARIVLDGLIREAVTDRHLAFRELGRELCELDMINLVLPIFRDQVSAYTLDRSVRLAQARLELAASAIDDLVTAIGNEVIGDAVEDVTVEVQAQKEAEEAAANAEESEGDY